MTEFEPTQPNDHTTTLVIEKIPSQVGYELAEMALSAGETITREELAKRVQERLNEEYTILSGEELEALLKQVVKCSIFDIKEPISFYMEEREEFTPEESIKAKEEEVDEFGRTPYIRSLIEQAKEEMRQKRNTERDQDPTPNPPFHM